MLIDAKMEYVLNTADEYLLVHPKYEINLMLRNLLCFQLLQWQYWTSSIAPCKVFALDNFFFISAMSSFLFLIALSGRSITMEETMN